MKTVSNMIAVILSLFIVWGVLALPAQSTAQQRDFNDVPVSHWGYDTIKWAVNNEIVQGDGKGNFLPDARVTEGEFLAMLFRAYRNEIDIRAKRTDEQWHAPYYEEAANRNWPVNAGNNAFNRGNVASLLAYAAGKDVSRNDAIQYLLDQGLARGKTTNTVAGYKAGDTLTRAEAATFIYRFKQQLPSLPTAPVKGLVLRGIGLGASEQQVLERLGQPARKDASEYGFTWYIYNSDYANYAQIGISQNKVVALFSNAAGVWSSDNGVEEGITASKLSQILKETIGNRKSYSHQSSSANTTYYFDEHKSYNIDAIFTISRSATSSAAVGEEVWQSYERQIFDLTNVFRLKHGVSALLWDDPIAGTARRHSKDMEVKGYFDHTNLDGLSPFDRMKADGIRYSAAAENIASGYSNAISVYNGWLNSKGHRVNMLNSNLHRLGVGVYEQEYTQNFYTPL